MKIKFLFLAGVLFLCGCATIYNPATNRRELIFVDTAKELTIGRKAAAQLTNKYPLEQDAALQERVRVIGARVAGVSDRKDIEYKFSALADKETNALTLPGGFIYINKGLIDILSDDEIAYVLGHEIGHTAARHIAKKIQTHMSYEVLFTLVFAGLGNKAASSGVQNAARAIDNLYSLVQLAYSRQDEYEADRLAVKYAYQAGFKANAALSALEKIKKQEGPNWKILGYFRTHPYVEERIKALKSFIPRLSGNAN